VSNTNPEWIWGGVAEPPPPGTRAYFCKTTPSIPARLQGVVGEVVRHPTDFSPNHVTLRIGQDLVHCMYDDVMIERR
jgi:hypothetical protein